MAVFPRESGIAPSRTPCGQMYLQKNGSLIPTEFVTSIGRSITKTIRMIYFRYLNGFSLAVENFLPGILCSKSWNHPNGHKKPHINLPSVTPSKINNPVMYYENLKLEDPTTAWKAPIGHAPAAAGQE